MKTSTIIELTAIVAVTFAAAAVSFQAHAESKPLQKITIAPKAIPDLVVGEVASFQVKYQTLPNFETVNGLGLRLHYDSSVLQFESMNGLYMENLLAISPIEPDYRDYDNDPDTDQYIHIAWADWRSGDWVGDNKTPMDLYQVSFGVVGPGETKIRFSQSSSVMYRFKANTAKLVVKSDQAELDECQYGLDIDQDGSVNALTDGIMLQRYQFGFRGDNLTENMDADAEMVEANIECLNN